MASSCVCRSTMMKCLSCAIEDEIKESARLIEANYMHSCAVCDKKIRLHDACGMCDATICPFSHNFLFCAGCFEHHDGLCSECRVKSKRIVHCQACNMRICLGCCDECNLCSTPFCHECHLIYPLCILHQTEENFRYKRAPAPLKKCVNCNVI